jgi:hypothetical protein
MNIIPLAEAEPNGRGIHAIVKHLFIFVMKPRPNKPLANTLRITTGWNWVDLETHSMDRNHPTLDGLRGCHKTQFQATFC